MVGILHGASVPEAEDRRGGTRYAPQKRRPGVVGPRADHGQPYTLRQLPPSQPMAVTTAVEVTRLSRLYFAWMVSIQRHGTLRPRQATLSRALPRRSSGARRCQSPSPSRGVLCPLLPQSPWTWHTRVRTIHLGDRSHNRAGSALSRRLGRSCGHAVWVCAGSALPHRCSVSARGSRFCCCRLPPQSWSASASAISLTTDSASRLGSSRMFTKPSSKRGMASATYGAATSAMLPIAVFAFL